MTPHHPYGCRCAGCTTRAALALLETGRPAMARPLLAELVDLIPDELDRAYAKGHDDACGAVARKRAELRDLDARIGRARRELAGLEGKRSANARWLAEALVARRITPERVAEVLGIRPGDVPPIAEGRVGLAGTAWRKVLREIGG